MPAFAEVKKELNIPDGVKTELDDKTGTITVIGPQGSLSRSFSNPMISLELKNNVITLFSKFVKKQVHNPDTRAFTLFSPTEPFSEEPKRPKCIIVL